MAELRVRKPVNGAPQEQQDEDRSKSKSLRQQHTKSEAEPNIFVLAGSFIVFTLVVGSLLFYAVDSRENGPFAAWVNEKYPSIERALTWQSTPLFGASAESTTGSLKLTEEELKAYDGTDKDKPIYLAIDGTIFDVSVSPAFYGPGGHYHHFVGKDATRAWITECWDEPEQFTWRMDDVEVMFMNTYLDETLESASEGDFGTMGELGENTQKMMGEMAKKAMAQLGSVTDKEKKQRRKTDVVEAKAKVKEVLEHWKSFFSGNDKYKIVGEVILDKTRPEPPKPCAKAMEKRPMKGGKLQSLMGKDGSLVGGKLMGGGAGGAGKGKDKKGAMPDFVKAMQADKKKKDAEEAKAKPKGKTEEEENDDDVYHEEL